MPEDTAISPAQARNYQIPGCSVHINNDSENGIPVADLLNIVFSLVTSNPEAMVDFRITVLGNG